MLEVAGTLLWLGFYRVRPNRLVFKGIVGSTDSVVCCVDHLSWHE